MKYSKLGGGWRRRLRHDRIFPVRRPPQLQLAGDRSPGGRRRGSGEERKQSVCGGRSGQKPRGTRDTWKIKPAGGGEGSFTEGSWGPGQQGEFPGFRSADPRTQRGGLGPHLPVVAAGTEASREPRSHLCTLTPSPRPRGGRLQFRPIHLSALPFFFQIQGFFFRSIFIILLLFPSQAETDSSTPGRGHSPPRPGRARSPRVELRLRDPPPNPSLVQSLCSTHSLAGELNPPLRPTKSPA